MKKKTMIIKIIGGALVLISIISLFVYFTYFNQANKQIENENALLISDFYSNAEDTSSEGESEDPSISDNQPYRISTNKKTDGVLKIDCIDLELPIFTDMTKKNLNQSACRVPGTEKPGSRNYCIMGHYMRRQGVIFNRLNEVKNGDIVSVKTKSREYIYQVYDIEVTNGLDYSIFDDVDNKQIITLFCCDYSVKDGRRIVRGDLIKIT